MTGIASDISARDQIGITDHLHRNQQRTTTDSLTVQVFRKHSSVPAVDMDVRFLPDAYEIKAEFRGPTGLHTPRTFRFTVAGGRVSLIEGADPLPDNGEDIAEVVCQRLLEPLLEPFTRE